MRAAHHPTLGESRARVNVPETEQVRAASATRSVVVMRRRCRSVCVSTPGLEHRSVLGGARLGQVQPQRSSHPCPKRFATQRPSRAHAPDWPDPI